jgi:hypothetical protein
MAILEPVSAMRRLGVTTGGNRRWRSSSPWLAGPQSLALSARRLSATSTARRYVLRAQPWEL